MLSPTRTGGAYPASGAGRMPRCPSRARKRRLAGISANGDVDVAALFEPLQRGGAALGRGPGRARRPGGDRLAARDEAERLWPVSADRSLRLRPGVRGGVGTPVKAVLRKLMRWYVEPLASTSARSTTPCSG